MCVCVYVHVYICVYICIYVYIYMYIFMYLLSCFYVHRVLLACKWCLAYVCACVHVYMYVYVFSYQFVHVFIYLFICIYSIHIHQCIGIHLSIRTCRYSMCRLARSRVGINRCRRAAILVSVARV